MHERFVTPLVPDQGSDTPTHETPVAPRRDVGVLVVDDNALNAKLLRLALEATGYTVRVAESAAVARYLVQSVTPDIALLDVQMPEVDGLTLLREWRADTQLPAFPVIVISAFASGEDLDRAYAAGADAFLPKPVNIRFLLRMVERLAAVRAVREHD